MYAETNYKSGKALKDAFKNGEKIRVYQPGGMFPGTTDGRCVVEGPWYPACHRFWVSVMVEDSVIVKILKD